MGLGGRMMERKDILDRQGYVEGLLQFVNCLSDENSSCSFAIDGGWGTGKSYVLNMFEEQLDEIQSEKTADNKFLVFHYNCWRYDYYDEPAIAIVASMIDKIESEEAIGTAESDKFVRAGWNVAKDQILKIAGEFTKNKIGINLVELTKDLEDQVENGEVEKNSFDKLFAFRKTLESTRKYLKELAEYKSIVFVVDELDRCLPMYAIKVMERLHHIFEGIENITVIMAIDRKQMHYSITQIFGKGTDVDNYLKKFIDFTFVLDTGKVSQTVFEKYQEYFGMFSEKSEEDRNYLIKLYQNIYQGIDIRTQEKLISRARLVHHIVCKDQEKDIALLCFELLWIFLNNRQQQNVIYDLVLNNEFTYSQVSELLGKNLADYLKKIESELGGGVTTIYNGMSYRKLEETVYDRMFWIMAAITGDIKGETCQKYHFKKVNEYTDEVGAARKFVEIAEKMSMGALREA